MSHRHVHRFCSLLACTALFAVRGPTQDDAPAVRPDREATWATWRGGDGTGAAPASNPPVAWSENENIRWKVALPGLGNSSPVIWQDRIYLSTAVQTDKDAPASGSDAATGRRPAAGGFRGQAPTTKIHEFFVLALDRKDGRMAWQTKVNETVPHEAGHPTGSYASNSPVTDGEHVWAHFGSRGIHCLDRNGKIVWSKDLGRMQTRNDFGEGSSPALYGNTLVVAWDHEGDSFVIALDKATGKELWRQPRQEITSWSTPVVAAVGDGVQVILSATGASRGYDLATGEQLWSMPGMTTNCIPTPIHKDGVAYLMSGFRGASFQAIRLAGAKGDLKDSDNVVWQHGRDTSYVPSALLYDGYLYFLSGNNGLLSCLDAATGKPHYERQKLEGIRSIYSSPVGAGGRVYLTSRTGTTKVIKLGPVYEEIATSQLDDGFDASAAIAGDAIYLRGRKNLYCIAEQ